MQTEIEEMLPPKLTKNQKKTEQNAMNQRGGVQHLDNKRNEIRPSDWSKYKVKPIK